MVDGSKIETGKMPVLRFATTARLKSSASRSRIERAADGKARIHHDVGVNLRRDKLSTVRRENGLNSPEFPALIEEFQFGIGHQQFSRPGGRPIGKGAHCQAKQLTCQGQKSSFEFGDGEKN
jgi:hypothetical protein